MVKRDCHITLGLENSVPMIPFGYVSCGRKNYRYVLNLKEMKPDLNRSLNPIFSTVE